MESTPPKKPWWRRHYFLISSPVILVVTLVMTSAVWINLSAMEENRIKEYQTLSSNMGQTAKNFVLLQQYDNLLDLMQLLTKTSHIQYMAFYIDGECVLQAGNERDIGRPWFPDKDAAEEELKIIRTRQSININMPLSISGDRRTFKLLRIVFSLADFQERKDNIIQAIGVILSLLVVVIVLLVILNSTQCRLEKQNVILHQTQKQLQQEENTKSEMIRAISHHAMQFLTAIYGKIFNLLNQKQASVPVPVLTAGLKNIRENTDALKRTLENLKDNERLNKGQVKCLSRQIDLVKLIQIAGQNFEESLAKRKISLEFIRPPGQQLVWADPEIVKPVIMNLLDNAVKFSPDSSCIKIKVAVEDKLITTCVQDAGSGIDKADWNKIFQPFVRLHPKIRGTGLGLSNSRQLIRLQGGDLGVAQSEPGTGTTFCFTLPLAETRSEEKAEYI
ncbi:HAMP domain-containing histidine kinase [bacterium]|nr:HAMP domain-containing histidine kinase [bacterium]